MKKRFIIKFVYFYISHNFYLKLNLRKMKIHRDIRPQKYKV